LSLGRRRSMARASPSRRPTAVSVNSRASASTTTSTGVPPRRAGCSRGRYRIRAGHRGCERDHDGTDRDRVGPRCPRLGSLVGRGHGHLQPEPGEVGTIGCPSAAVSAGPFAVPSPLYRRGRQWIRVARRPSNGIAHRHGYVAFPRGRRAYLLGAGAAARSHRGVCWSTCPGWFGFATRRPACVAGCRHGAENRGSIDTGFTRAETQRNIVRLCRTASRRLFPSTRPKEVRSTTPDAGRCGRIYG
jgi:hypothetical protein